MTQRTAAAQRTKYILDEADLPTQWYNIQADLKTPVPPVLHPGTGQPIGPQDLAPLFPMEMIKQEVSQERWIDIPEEVRDVYACGGLPRCTGPDGWNGRSIPLPVSTTSTRASARPAATSPTQPWPRRTTTSRKG